MSRKDTQRQVDAIRSRSSELENHLIDEYRSGYISRRDFVRRGGVIGMSIPVVGFLAAACGTGSNTSTSSGGSADTAVKAGGKDVAVKPGGTLKLGMSPGPTTEIDPIKVADEGGLGVMSQSGEFLSWSDSKLQLQPRLAESWKPNSDGSVWTFKIRQGVKFHDGTPMTADDVASSINALSDPKNGSNALSTFAGVLSKGSAKATDASTVEFQLDGPNGNFPYLLGQLQLADRPEEPQRVVGEDLPRHRPVEAGEVHGELRRLLRPEQGLLGQDADPEARPPAGQVLPQGAGPDPGAPVG
jgi:peptide/nickel transport system substrate-binding protein